MSIPTQGSFHRIVLGVMLDGVRRTPKQIREVVLPVLDMTDDEHVAKTEKGTAPIWEGRTAWSVQYLQRANLLKRVSRGLYEISNDGIELYETGIDGNEISNYVDKLIAEINPWNITPKQKNKDDVNTVGVSVITSDVSPEEGIAEFETKLNEDLSSQLIDMIMDKTPDFFERLVVELLEKMGYGTGVVTQYSNDGGIDGLVTTDELGFRPIMTQAKRYMPGQAVGRPEVQSFVGALNGANNGVFITTARFTKEAISYAEGYPNATISLIDGRRLAELMIKYDIGVSTIRTVRIKRIDTDYFEG
jgi:restriction system protein